MTERQLHLFKSRRQRGTRPPAPPEFKLHCLVADSLRQWLSHGWVWTHIPLGEKRDPVTGSRLKRMGVSPGWPDFIFIPPMPTTTSQFSQATRICMDAPASPRPHFLELKRHGRGRLTEAQAGFAAWCVANGCPHAVAYGYEEALAVLKGWGVLRAGVHVQ